MNWCNFVRCLNKQQGIYLCILEYFGCSTDARKNCGNAVTRRQSLGNKKNLGSSEPMGTHGNGRVVRCPEKKREKKKKSKMAVSGARIVLREKFAHLYETLFEGDNAFQV